MLQTYALSVHSGLVKKNPSDDAHIRQAFEVKEDSR
jgi:hypothetical protein